MSRILDVYLHEIFAGKLTQNDAGQLLFAYDETYLSIPDLPQISISLPKIPGTYKENNVRSFFSGLLPDENARYRIAKCLGVSEKNPFSLLAAIGGECAGALALYPEGVEPNAPNKQDIEILDNNKLHEILELLKIRPLMAGLDNIRLSLAGAQDKLAVGLVDNKIALVHGTSPTTHILKPIIEGIQDSVHNEYFCLRLAADMGLNIPNAEIGWNGDTPYFLIERYDRIRDANNVVKRLHQEDFCQALGILPELKYENEGGPSVASCLDLLNKNTMNPIVARNSFIRLLIFNYLIGNADAHGKNFSLLYTGKGISLAPAYDLLCTEAYPNVSLKMAMKIGGKYDPYTVFARHWHKLIPNTAAARNALNKELLNMSAQIVDKAQALRVDLNSKGINSVIFEDILKVIKRRAEQVQTDVKNPRQKW